MSDLSLIQNLQRQLKSELLRRDADKARKSLHFFLEHFAWPVLFPATEFKDNWHLHVICEHLEAITRGEIRKLLINMPFRHLKSTIISQTWPAWEWIDLPSTEYLTAAYQRDLATRDAVNSRRIIESENYQLAFGDSFQMTSDQNVKTRYENNKRGQRTITSTDSAGTGFGGGRLIIDDPISAKDADSITKINESVEWYKGTIVTRMNDPMKDAIVITHQRLNEGDLTGYILDNDTDKEWTHLVLPMRYDPELTKTTFLGAYDPRKTKGELLHPERMDEATTKSTEKTLGEYHTNAQLQQNPGTRGGIIFVRSKFGEYTKAPAKLEKVISVDCTFKDLKSSDYVAIGVWGRDPDTEKKYLLYRIRDKLGFGATCTTLTKRHQQIP
jgi:hypothetical protein